MRLIKSFLAVSTIAASLATLQGCANTIRGAGQDTANAVDATQSAGRKVVRSVGG